MSARIIDGKQVAEGLRATIAQRVAGLGWRPGLRVVRVGGIVGGRASRRVGWGGVGWDSVGAG